MAISNLREYAHLTEQDVAAIGDAFDAIRRDVEEVRGDGDAAYIRRVIAWQRKLAVAGRVTLFASPFLPAWIAGTALLSAAKVLENMEIGHNVMHGQWDWMNDPEIHSMTWEWDNVAPAAQWRHSHNFEHHTFTNVIGKDKDVGYEILRVSDEQPWHVVTLGQPLYNALLALFFEWGVALHDLDIEGIWHRDFDQPTMRAKLRQIGRKAGRQVLKDYVLFPALTGPAWLSTLTAGLTANLVRNVWSYLIIFCGHFPDGAVRFTTEQLESESRSEWYLRQLYGSANFTGSRLLHVLSGSLGYQIEHHLFPDLPSNRYPEIAQRVRQICAKHRLPYTSGSLHRQYAQSLRRIWRLSLPPRTTGRQPNPPTLAHNDQPALAA